MYQIAICDDERKILSDMHVKIEKSFADTGIEAIYFCTDDSAKMMEALQNKVFDVLFLDIDMPHISGMDIAAYLTENKLQTILVFVTSQDALVYKTFAYRPFGFIRKTYFEEELREVVERIEKEFLDRKQELTIKKGQELIRIFIQDVVYIETEGNYLNIVTTNGVMKTRETMTNMEKELCRKNFVRCHKGYLVNMAYIARIKNGEIMLQWCEKNMLLPIGRSYEKDVRKKLIESFRM